MRTITFFRFALAGSLLLGTVSLTAADKALAARGSYRPPGPIWSWVRQAGGTNDEGGSVVQVDAENCLYVLGYFQRPAAGGQQLDVNSMEPAQFLARYDSRGDVLWARTPRGRGLLAADRAHLDGTGHLYLMGTLNGEADFGGHRISSSGPAIFIAKYDRAGRVLWASRVEALDADDAGFLSVVDRGGDVYLGGTFSRTIRIGRYIFSPTGNNLDTFVAKFDPRGAVLWARQSSIPEPDWPKALAADDQGNVYVAGTIELWEYNPGTGTFEFCQHTLLSRYDERGNVVWTIRSEDPGNAAAGLTLDARGNMFLAGIFTGRFSLGGEHLTRSTGEGAYLARVHANGEVRWARSLGETEEDRIRDLAVAQDGEPYIAGDFQGTATFGQTQLISESHADAFVARFSGEGNALWARQMHSQYFGQAWRLQLDGFGRAYLLGEATGSVEPGRHTPSSGEPEYAHLFLASFDPHGGLCWLENLDSDTLCMWSSFAVTHTGVCYLAGSFAGTMTLGTDTLTSRGSRDFFLARLNQSHLPAGH